ncbi:MAG: Rpn family recombination-promoting nuclease/putative transposase, partial [Lachnospiraceae bacterium]|nr:Rpn family recombination-promoting nuclease/putative transposase [Lachnospiraceae bacterium]
MTKNTITSHTGKTQKSTNRERSFLEMHPLPAPEGFEDATGTLLFRMTNNAMFHIVFEACPEALKALIGALLRLSPEEIISVEVKNPITYDLSAYSKNFILDLKILLNGNFVLNIEMQVGNLNFWKERSLGYLCRAFDNLNRGDEYLKTKSAIHVGILDFHLDSDNQEFYSDYYMINERTQKKYSDKLRLSVLHLNQVENATEEDKAWHLDLWARFFKARTWEEVFMVAKKDFNIKNAALTFYRASADEYVRNFCEGVEEGERTLRTLQLELQQSKDELHQKDEALLQKDNEIARLLAR